MASAASESGTRCVSTTTPRSRPPFAVITDLEALAVRGIRLTLRKPDALLTSLLLPVMLMLLFVHLLGGTIQTGTRYVTYVVPGVIVLCLALGSSTTAVSVSDDIAHGIIDRFRSMDIGGPAFLGGQVAASIVRDTASTALVFGVAFLIGFRPDAGVSSWVIAIGLILMVMLAISWMSAVFGLLVNSPEAASSFTFFMLFFPYASSGFVPIDTMPSWLRGFAGHQPSTPIIESIRSLLLGRPVGSNLWIALVWCGAILLVSIVLSSLLFQRRTS